VLAVADALRPEAPACMAALQKLGVSETVMLTGDNERVAAAVARQSGLVDFRADLMPEDKVTALRELSRRFGPVAMVGDGVNDAPALAHAAVGIALGGAATDVALETADVVLMGNDLAHLPYAVGLGRATRAIIVQNLALAFGVMGLLSVAALLGLAGMGVAVIFHEGSTIAVVLNALRLLSFKKS
jgi:Cd2+/Zn2+-exporting ATPase